MHFVLPWLVAAAGLVLYLLTLNRWVSFASVDLTAKVAGWDWNTMHLGAVTLVVTWPIRWLPPGLQAPALNVLGALFAAGALGFLAKSVALLPHDRTRDQRQRERSDFGFLTMPFAWIPPVAAAGLLAFQLTFWEHATSMTGDMITLFLFASCVFCFLRFRVMQEDRWLAILSFTFGAAAANDWGMVAFGPLFFGAILWAKGVAFFDGPFLIRTTAAGLLGLLFYLVQPLAVQLAGQADGGFFELLRTQLGNQRQLILGFPRAVVFFCALPSVMPLVFIAIRWPSTFGDLSAAGTAITNSLFRVIYLAFLAFGTWVMFDPPFSPRALGFGLPFLHLYYLTALVVGYAAGYVMLVFGQDPDRKIPRPSDAPVFGQRLLAGLAAIGPLGAAAALAVYSLPAIRSQNGPLIHDLADTLVTAEAERPVLLSDDNALLMMAMGRLAEQGKGGNVIPVFTQMLERHVYQRHHEKRYGSRWPALAVERLPEPLDGGILLQQVLALASTNQLYYLHPSVGYYFEPFHLRPTNTIYQLELLPTNSWLAPALTDAEFQAADQRWEALRERLVEDADLARMRRVRNAGTTRVAGHFSRGLNTWGVVLQRRGRLDAAAKFFEGAAVLNKDNLAAAANVRFNANLRAGRREPGTPEKDVNEQLRSPTDVPVYLSAYGPVDDPAYCRRLGDVYLDSNLFRQACQQYSRALELQPDLVEARLSLVRAAQGARFLTEALAMVTELRRDGTALTPDQTMEVYRMEAWIRVGMGDLPAAEKALADAQAKFPEQVRPSEILTEIYIVSNQTNAALKAAERVIAQRPSDARPLVNKAAILMHLGGFGEAVTALNTALEMDPNLIPALVNRANCYNRLGRIDDAERDYKQLLERAENMISVHYHLGEIDYQRGNAIEARRHYRKFLEGALPGSPEARAAQKRLDEIASGKKK